MNAPTKKSAAARKATSPAAKQPSPAAAKAPAKKVVKAPQPKVTPAPAPKTDAKADAKADKPRKPKLVRDSFTIPKAEYTVLEALKARAAKAGAPAKKSELLRAGIKALAAMDDAAFVAAARSVPALKTGRPAKT